MAQGNSRGGSYLAEMVQWFGVRGCKFSSVALHDPFQAAIRPLQKGA